MHFSACVCYAITQYILTIGKLEPSYVIRKVKGLPPNIKESLFHTFYIYSF